MFGIKTSMDFPIISDFSKPNKLVKLFELCIIVHFPLSFELQKNIKSWFSKTASKLFP